MGNTLTNLVYHVVFSTKIREPMIIPEIKEELYRYMGAIIKGEGGVLLAINGIADHIHMIIKLKPVHSLSSIMQKIKGRSSKWINEHKKVANKFGWQDGYGAFTLSESQVSMVIRYVKDQEHHHSHLSFKDEFILFLKRHRVEYDERHLWL